MLRHYPLSSLFQLSSTKCQVSSTAGSSTADAPRARALNEGNNALRMEEIEVGEFPSTINFCLQQFRMHEILETFDVGC